MPANSENESIMQTVGNRNLDEMCQQTLDALKVVQSFEVKPARSARVQELLAQKSHSRVPVADKKQSRAARSPVPPAQGDGGPQRQALQPVTESTSPERRFASSPKKVSAVSESSLSPLSDRGNRVREASPAKSLFAKRLRPAAMTETPAPGQYSGSMEWPASMHTPAGAALKKSTVDADSSIAYASTTQGPGHASRRGNPVSSFRSVSRLLQPTAASAAKMRPVRAAMGPVRQDRLAHADKQARADTSITASRPATTAASGHRPSAFLMKPVSSSGSTMSKPAVVPSLALRHQSRLGLSQLSANAQSLKPALTPSGLNLPSAIPRANLKTDATASSSSSSSSPSLSPLASTPVPSLQPPKSLLSSVLTKTHNDKQPAAKNTFVSPGQLQTPSAVKPKTTPQLASVPPYLLGQAEVPSVTSTPAREAPNVSVGEHTSGSFHSFDFTNFSFEADWVNTPELRKKVLEQKNDDTVQLFGHMPPIDLDSIFGAEMKRQRR